MLELRWGTIAVCALATLLFGTCEAQEFVDSFDDGSLDNWEVVDFHGDVGSASVSTECYHSAPYSAHCWGSESASIQRVGFLAAGGRYRAWLNIRGDQTADGNLIFQRMDGGNCYSVNCCPIGSDNPSLNIAVWVGGQPTFLASKVPTFGFDTWFELVVDRHADGSIAVFVNGVLELSAVDTTFTESGGFALASWRTAFIDDVSYSADVSTGVPDTSLSPQVTWGRIKALY